jgi:hypothetical protein
MKPINIVKSYWYLILLKLSLGVYYSLWSFYTAKLNLILIWSYDKRNFFWKWPPLVLVELSGWPIF